MKPKDSQAMRFMIDLKVEINNINGDKLVKIKLLGQSFIYHQIRKMIGAILQSLVGNKGLNLIQNSFASNKMEIWLAPSNGLLLDSVI